MSLLEIISEKINSQHSDFNSHLLLSIFKMAEVEIVESESSSAVRKEFQFNYGLQKLLIIFIIQQIIQNIMHCSLSRS